MKIVILDGYTENPGDLSWEDMATLGELTVYDRTSADQVVERIAGHEIVITNKTPITAEIINQSPDMRYIGVLATGYNVVDIDAARRHGIAVCNIPAYSTDSVAQLTFALLLEMCHHVGAHSEAVHGGRWERSADFCFWDYPLAELNGKTMGLIGFGNIGQRVAKIAAAFGMQVLVYNRTVRRELETDRIRFASLDEVLSQSDVISLHCPLTEQTRNLINEETIGRMKDGVMLINTARGPLIDEAALARALRQGKVSFAGLDVLSTEPPRAGNPLLKEENCLITPHIAWAPKEARIRLMTVAVSNVRAFLEGSPQNVVNP